MTTVTVTVTAGHITRGTPGSGSGCAIALALLDAFPGATDASVGDYAGVFYNAGGDLDDRDAWALLPGAARHFVRDFDDRQPVGPFTFTLDIPAVAA